MTATCKIAFQFVAVCNRWIAEAGSFKAWPCVISHWHDPCRELFLNQPKGITMKRTKVNLVMLGVIAALGMTPMPALAGPATGAQEEKPEKGQKPFEGKVEAIDSAAKTFTVAGKLVYTSDTTKFSKDGKAIKLSDIAVGDEVHGTTHQTYDGKTEALTVKVGKKEKDGEAK